PKETSMLTPPTISKNWFNFSDILDKVALNYMLSDDFTKNKNEVIPVDFLVVNDYEIVGKRNPHKSYGYLRTPEFSKVLADFIQTKSLTSTQKLTHKIIRFVNLIKFNFRKKK
ncbi:MAG: hypothetical protein QM503_11340, partial [Bacteroidota bacterium]